MQDEKKDATGIKTHEEIQALFDSLRQLEEKIKNPKLLVEEVIEPHEPLKELKNPAPTPQETLQEQNETKPSAPLFFGKKERHWFSFKKETTTHAPDRKEKHRVFWRKPTTEQNQSEKDTLEQQIPRRVKPLHSTFTLQLDAQGNLVGLPQKKQTVTGEKKPLFAFRKSKNKEGLPAEQPPKGIKGKLITILSRIKPSKSESSGGLLGKIKGVFKRKST